MGESAFRRRGRGVLLVAAVVLVAIVVRPTGIAVAESPARDTLTGSPASVAADAASPTVTLDQPKTPSKETRPLFTGSASDTTEKVTVQIYAGATATGSPVSVATAKVGSGHRWRSQKPNPALSDGQYTATATQVASGGEEGKSLPAMFIVDTTPPVVTLTSPLSGSSAGSESQLVEGTAGTAEGDMPGITIRLFAGSTVGAQSVQQLTVQASNGAWAATFATLSPGTYTARAEQLDDAGNTGNSEPATFTVTTPTHLTPPSVITPAVPPPTFSAFAGTITPTRPTVSLMQPFPIVRFAGTQTASGVRLRLLTVQQLPAGAQIAVRCRGRGCPLKSAVRLTVSGRRGVAPVEFRGFERFLRSGITLEVLVSKPGQIGEYTRFVIRRGKLPERVDMCLDPAPVKPLVCPSS